MENQKQDNLEISSQIQERNSIFPSEIDIKNFIQQNLEIGHLEGKVSSLIKENESALLPITGFENTAFFRSEMSTFQFLSEYYKKKEPEKKILYLGFPQTFSQSNFTYIHQLRGAKAFLTERSGDVAALILDPLLLIQKSIDFAQRIHSLRALCSGSGIPFILDERKTTARIHQKGLNFIFQFNANAVLLGENLSLGISLGALAHSPDFFDETFLPGTFAPKAEGLLACKKITEKLNNAAHRSYIDWNRQGSELCEAVNRKLKNEFPFGLMNNFGSILWLNNFGCNRAHKKLQRHNILKGSERCLYLPPGLNEEERKEFMNKIVDTLTKRKARFEKMKQADPIQQKSLQIV